MATAGDTRGKYELTAPCILNADMLDFCREYDGEPFHAALLDPPYHLTSIVKRFGGENATPAQSGKSGDKRRASAGFLGKQWDGGDIAFRPETWEAIASVLHPGAFILAFCGSRGWHRQACAMEDAGLIIHPTFFRLYAYGSGFPKSTRIRDSRFANHRYSLQAIKPSVEPIICAQKPYTGKPVECITTTGAGAWNIGAGRVSGSAGIRKEEKPRHGGVFSGNQTRPYIERALQAGVPARPTYETPEAGRWPANLLIEAGRIAELLDAQSGVSVSSGGQCSRPTGFGEFGGGTRVTWKGNPGFGDIGGSSRFFHNSNWRAEIEERLRSEFPCRYVAKAGRREKDAGLDTMKQVRYNETERSTDLWESTDQSQAILPEPDIPHEKGITDSLSGTQQQSLPETSLHTTTCGNNPTDQSPQDTKSTIGTETSKTTDSKTSNLLIPLRTSGCIADANSEKGTGGSLALSVENSNQSQQNSGTSVSEAIHSTTDANRVTFDGSLPISVNENRNLKTPVKEAGNRVGICNSHPT